MSAFGTIAIAICYDIRFPSLIQYARQQNPDICAYILPSAFNMSSGPAAWEILQRVRCVRSTNPFSSADHG
jgi:omega-amidase